MSREKKQRSTAHRVTLLVIVSLVLGVNLYVWNAKRVLDNQLPMPFGYGMSVVVSGSMEPTLSVDELVFIRRTQDVSVGDVVVYQRDDSLIIHRVIAVGEDSVITQGDANNVADDPVAYENIKGVMVGHIPGVGQLVWFIRKPVVSLAVLVLAIWLLELSYRQDREQDGRELEAIKDEIRRLRSEQKDD